MFTAKQLNLVQSSTPGKCWDIAPLKLRGVVTGTATEVEVKRENGFTSVAYSVFDAHRVHVPTTHTRATARANAEAVAAVLAKLKADGLTNGLPA